MLPVGKELALMTDLPFEISQKELEDLYYQRWEIEKKYHTLKNKTNYFLKFMMLRKAGAFSAPGNAKSTQ